MKSRMMMAAEHIYGHFIMLLWYIYSYLVNIFRHLVTIYSIGMLWFIECPSGKRKIYIGELQKRLQYIDWFGSNHLWKLE